MLDHHTSSRVQRQAGKLVSCLETRQARGIYGIGVYPTLYKMLRQLLQLWPSMGTSIAMSWFCETYS